MESVKQELLVSHIENRLFANGTLNMRKRKAITLCMNGPAESS